ncbi:hypothetical protein HELRODRAFT_125959, partial [Helobdella robusta]|uniref:RHD domain-containing protein n=1 Tax=Helobdella robusta TaxID=6412 RepID=T1EH78_HELRO
PYIEIVTQPKKTSLRFRYSTESRKAGNIYGDSCTESNPTFPTIKINNYRGPMRAMMLCVTEDGCLHPHKLVGNNCRPDGICVVDVKEPLFDDLISFTNVGVQCCRKDDVKK